MLTGISKNFLNAYNWFMGLFPESYIAFVNIGLLSVLIALYGIFIWLFYRFLAKRDIVKLELNKYNKFSHASLVKLFVGIFYIIEYVIILPFIVFLWFSVLSALMIFISQEENILNILFITTALVTAIRITSYYKEDLSKDLAKMIPFTFLGVTLLDPSFLSVSRLQEKIVGFEFFLEDIFSYALFIIGVEIFFRIIYLIRSSIKKKKVKKESENPQ